MSDNGRSLRICWIAGIPAAGLVIALALFAESLRAAGRHGTGDLLSVVQFLVYFAWFRLTWRASRGIVDSALKPLARGALATGLVLSAMF